MAPVAEVKSPAPAAKQYRWQSLSLLLFEIIDHMTDSVASVDGFVNVVVHVIFSKEGRRKGTPRYRNEGHGKYIRRQPARKHRSPHRDLAECFVLVHS